MNKNLGNLIDLNKDLNKIAIICEDQQITYKALDILANSVAYCLLKKNIKKGDRVAIISLNSIDYVIMYLGILKLGAVAVLINVKSPQSQIDYILKDSDCKMILKEIADLEIPIGIEFLFNTPIEENDPAIILYTSGSTSSSKGVILSHKKKVLLDIKSKNSKEEIVIISTPLYHGHGLNNLELSLSSHSTVVLLPKFDAKNFINSLEKNNVTIITGNPTMMYLILNEKKLLEKTNLNSIKEINLGSSPLTQNLYDKLKKTFKKSKISSKYGLTEVGAGLFYKHPTLKTPPLSVGYPNPSIQYRIVNGILEIKSPSMMIKYTNQKDNRTTKDGYFITNDLFKIDEQGFYYYMGRSDDMFINGGNNIYPFQIESALETHPFIEEAVVIGLEDDIKGMKPYSFIKVSKDVTEEEIKEHILKQLPPSHCPKRIWILEQFPLLAINKIDKIKLKEIAKSNI